MLPMRLFTTLDRRRMRERRARFKLALVGLDEAFDLASGGAVGRHAQARRAGPGAGAGPELLFLDEPGAGLDPVNAARLDELVQHLQQDLQTAVVMVTHDVASVRAVAGRVLYLDDQPGTPPLLGHLADLLQRGPADVQAFFQRGHAAAAP
jgi:phospholipid/cholesterol/gamma-HCH transport system ATP-binding protein